MSLNIYSFWGKKQYVNHHQQYWLPLIQHLQDTQHAITYLYKHNLSIHQKVILKPVTKNMIAILGYLHDIGKVTPAFQAKDSTAYKSVYSKTPHNIAGEVILLPYFSQSFADLIGAHHGLPCNKRELYLQQTAYRINYGDQDYTTARKKIIENILSGLNSDERNLLKTYQLSLQQQAILSGLIIEADWLASNTNYFPLIKSDRNYTDINQSTRLSIAENKFRKENNDNQIFDNSSVSNFKFRQIFGFKPNNIQSTSLKLIQQTNDPGLIILEAPMGSGKTEFALAASLILSQKKKTNGLFFGLPTQATSNAMLPRLQQFLNLISDKKKQAILIHSNSNNVQKYTSDFYLKKLKPLQHFIIGTIDQLLAMSLKVRHVFLRHLAFSGKTIILDEIHSYDCFTNSYLLKTLEWLGSYDIPVIALSATLTSTKRTELVSAYLKGKNEFNSVINKGHNKVFNSSSNLNLKSEQIKQIKLAYPRLTYTDNNSVKYYDKFTAQPFLSVSIIRTIKNPAIIANKKSGVTGIICSSIKRAQEIYQQVKGEKILLHSAFLPQDRTEIENRIMNLIGKHGKRPKKLTVVGTQVLEQSLDIDFDTLISDLAPVDLLLQRIGRLWRNRKYTNRSVNKPVCYLCTDLNSEKISKTVYSEYLVNHAKQIIPDKIILPDLISDLVEKQYQDCPAISGYTDFKSEQKTEKQRAATFQLSDSKSDESISDLFSRRLPENSEKRAIASVRDIKPKLQVILKLNSDIKIDKKNYMQYLISLPYTVGRAVINFSNKNNPRIEEIKIGKENYFVLNLNQNGEYILDNLIMKYSHETGLSFRKINNAKNQLD